ncbi:hypothetical protein DFH11DRAFT_760530 [Phellopilus nigrolimitatus]|nr:hypothetical protein DFH11DRAFT_760530 [Phellopilus nigrolimitatus]
MYSFFSIVLQSPIPNEKKCSCYLSFAIARQAGELFFVWSKTKGTGTLSSISCKKYPRDGSLVVVKQKVVPQGPATVKFCDNEVSTRKKKKVPASQPAATRPWSGRINTHRIASHRIASHPAVSLLINRQYSNNTNGLHSNYASRCSPAETRIWGPRITNTRPPRRASAGDSTYLRRNVATARPPDHISIWRYARQRIATTPTPRRVSRTPQSTAHSPTTQKKTPRGIRRLRLRAPAYGTPVRAARRRRVPSTSHQLDLNQPEPKPPDAPPACP